ncbi:sensor histidine kinase [soil metagenome]
MSSPRLLLTSSLRVRLLAATVAGLAAALLLAGLFLNRQFSDHVREQFQVSLTQQLDQITARLMLDPGGRPVIAPETLSDPRWQQPLSGLYWQIDGIAANGHSREALSRSRSLWDSSIPLAADELAGAAVHVHEAPGPRNSRLLVLERTVRLEEQPGSSWRLVVAGDLKDTHEATEKFGRVLAVSLATLFLLLAAAAIAQLSIGLKPLRDMQRELRRVHDAQASSLQGRYPSEIQPLVDGFNRVLAQNRTVVERARTQAGNLAHALKTPLTVLEQAASRSPGSQDSALASLVLEQVKVARRHIDWHLARARVSATRHLPGQRTEVAGALAGLLRVMERLHAERGLQITCAVEPQAAGGPLYFAGEEQDLQEMLGNLLDNACKWACHSVQVQVDVKVHLAVQSGAAPPLLCIRIQDDGPGIDDANLKAVATRGLRFDESVPGTGLGLAIVQELAGLYGGRLEFMRVQAGGLSVLLYLPQAPVTAS